VNDLVRFRKTRERIKGSKIIKMKDVLFVAEYKVEFVFFTVTAAAAASYPF